MARSSFVPGRQLCRSFYEEAVKPALTKEFPSLPYSAGLLDYGSEVLGFDTPMSTDHDWGPRLQLFVRAEDLAAKDRITQLLSRELPASFKGYPTHYDPSVPGGFCTPGQEGQPLLHRVDIYSIPSFFEAYLDRPACRTWTTAEWLTVSEQKLATMASGPIFRDDLGLEATRRQAAHYPRDIWIYLMAAQWMAIGQEEPFLGRTGMNGDELGCHLITARLVQSAMRLLFLMERRYAPYSKWFGTAFNGLDGAESLQPGLTMAVQATAWQERAAGLAAAWKILAEKHNALGLTEPLATHVRTFHDRPFMVIDGESFAAALRDAITDPAIGRLPPIGSVNQWTQTVDFLENSALLRRAAALYTGPSDRQSG